MQPQTEKKRVLVADDVQETRRNTRVMLSMIDEVEVVALALDGAQAVEMARQQRPDIVILDINMPKVNGLLAYKKIAQENPQTGCIIVSAEKDPSAFRAAMSIGIQHYLVKPFTMDELERAVRDVIRRQNQSATNTQKTERLLEKNETYLRQLAEEYARTKRSDEKAIEVLEEVINLPNCELRWEQTLAMIYVVRQRWGKLKALAERLEKRQW
ncbi:MAG: response regulator transcription factor [Anaerolineales bacterium]|nr:response regulator transcription factor [Anaerolineales bacterium]